MNIFITAKPGSGKSTLIKNLVDFARKSGVCYCGLLTPEIREYNKRIGFELLVLPSQKRFLLAHVSFPEPKVSKYGVSLKAIENSLLELEKFLPKARVVFVDEIGKMEMLSKEFERFVYELLGSKKLVIATLSLAFAERFKRKGKIFRLNRENFNVVFETLKKELLKLKFASIHS